MPDPKTGEFRGNRNLKRLKKISQKKQQEEITRSLELGLEAAESINDRTISLFSRGHQPAFAGINTFLKATYCEDIRKVGDYEAAFVGIPFDNRNYLPTRHAFWTAGGATHIGSLRRLFGRWGRRSV